MKKQIILALTYFLIFALAPYATAQDVSPTPTAEPTVTPTTEPTTEPTAEPTNTTTPTPEPTVEPTPTLTVEPTNTTEPTPTNSTLTDIIQQIPSIPEFGRLEATTIMMTITIALAVVFTAVKTKRRNQK